MKAKCAACGRESEMSIERVLGGCVACGGELRRVIVAGEVGDVTPVVTAAATPEKLEVVGESMAAGIACPNCGKWIEAEAQICTACGYSRRLARTLTTRVGMPEVPKVKAKVDVANEIEAEKSYRRAKERARIGQGDGVRLVMAAMWVVVLGALVMAAGMGLIGESAPVRLPGVLMPPKFEAMNAGLMMGMFLVVAVPITAVGVRIAAAVTGVEMRTRLSWLRTAGVLAAVVVTMEVVFTVDQMFWHLEMPWLAAVLGAAGGVVMLVLTWWLHDVSFSGAMVLWVATVVSGAVGLLAAAAAFAWVGNFMGIDPVIKQVNTWQWPKLG